MTYTNFNKQNLKSLRQEMQEVLNKYGINQNIEFSVGNMTFNDSTVNIKVEAKVKGAATFEDVMLKSRVNALGLVMKNKYGDELVSYNSRSYKYPFIFKSAADGKRYKIDESMVKLRFAA